MNKEHLSPIQTQCTRPTLQGGDGGRVSKWEAELVKEEPVHSESTKKSLPFSTYKKRKSVNLGNCL